jgi:manganese transport protein
MNAEATTKKPSFLENWKSSGPAWMAAGLNIGGATVTNSVLMAAATGFVLGWVFVIATFAIYVVTYVCVELTMVTGKNPIRLIREEISPLAGWAVGLAILLVNLVFHTMQVVLGGLVLNTLLPVNQTFWGFAIVILTALFALIPSKAATVVAQQMLKWMVYLLSGSFLLTMFLVDIDWAGFFKGIFFFTIPTTKQSVLLFTAVLGSALAINVPAIQAFATKSSGWGKERLPLFRFETLLTNCFLLFVQLAVLIVVASTLFKANMQPKNAIQAALALAPLAGKFSTILFCVGLFGAIFSTMIAQTGVAAFTLSDTLGWDPEPGSKRFKLIQAGLLAIAFSVPLFGWNPFSFVTWGAAFNATFMPIGIAAWWYLINSKKVVGEYKAGTVFNIGLLVVFLIALVAAIRFWYVTLG